MSEQSSIHQPPPKRELLDFRSLEMSVLRWAEARRIIPNSSPLAQSTKTLEESGELLEAAARLKLLGLLFRNDPSLIKDEFFAQQVALARAAFKDAAGDVLVTLINGCALADVDLVECLRDAYEEIKDRKGTMNAAGVFVKEAS